MLIIDKVTKTLEDYSGLQWNHKRLNSSESSEIFYLNSGEFTARVVYLKNQKPTNLYIVTYESWYDVGEKTLNSPEFSIALSLRTGIPLQSIFLHEVTSISCIRG